MKHLMRKPLAALSTLSTATVLLPLLMSLHVLRHRVDRTRRAVQEGDRGAISIELALAIIALIAVAGVVLAALTGLGKQLAAKIKA